MKKIKILLPLSVFFLSPIYGYSLNNLWKATLENNIEVNNSYKQYENLVLSEQAYNGLFSPQLNFTSSTNMSDKDEERKLDSLNGVVSLSQNIPGGANVKLNGSYGCRPYQKDFTGKERAFHNPSVTLSLSQSLYPYWIQGKKKNPETYDLTLNKEYYYNLYLNSKKSAVLNITSLWFNLVNTKMKIDLVDKNISYKEKQRKALLELMDKGSIDYLQIIDIEQKILTDKQNKVDLSIGYEQYKEEFNLMSNGALSDNYINEDVKLDANKCKEIIGYDIDPYEKALQLKIEMAKNNVTMRKQNTAPVLGVDTSHNYSILQNDEKGHYSWNVTLSVDLSSFIHAKQSKVDYKEENQLSILQKEYEHYLLKKEGMKEQYSALIKDFSGQKENQEKLLKEKEKKLNEIKSEYDRGNISLLDLEGVVLEFEIQKASYKTSLLYYDYYSFLLNLITL